MNPLIKQNPHWYIEHLLERVAKLEAEIQALDEKKANKRVTNAKRTPKDSMDSQLPKKR